MATKKPTEKIKYFIVQRDSLSAYGNENGSDKAEAERLLEESPTEVGDLIIIRGEMITPKFQLD